MRGLIRVQGAAVEVALVGGGGPAARGRDRLQRIHGAVGIGCRGNTAKIGNHEHGERILVAAGELTADRTDIYCIG